MKQVMFKFFEPIKQIKTPQMKGFISASGKIILPKNFADNAFTVVKNCKIATDENTTKIKTLYLFPTEEATQFEVVENKKNYSIDFAAILDEQGFDYKSIKTAFTIASIIHEGQTVYELSFVAPKPTKQPAEPKLYTGAKRGPKPKAKLAIVE